MDDARILESLERIHTKIDVAMSEISSIKVSYATYNTRLKVLERIVYPIVAFVLLAFMVSISDGPKNSKASQPVINTVITKKIPQKKGMKYHD